MGKLRLIVTKTLYHNMYRCAVRDEDDCDVGFLSVIPGLPLEREQVPADAPEVAPFLLVIVEQAYITEDSMLTFEENVARSLLTRFATDTALPRYCQFCYPSPPAFLTEQDGASHFVS